MDLEPLCSICLDRLHQSSPLSILSTRQEKDSKLRVRLDPCKHEFHRGCIERWLAGNQRMSCAYCRTKAKQLTCCSSNQVLKTLVPHPPRSHSLHGSTLLTEHQRTVLSSMMGTSAPSSSRRRMSSRSSGSSFSLLPTNAPIRSVSDPANSSDLGAASSGNSGPELRSARGAWFMQKIRRLRQRIESSHSTLQNVAMAANGPSNQTVLSTPNPSFEQTLQQLVETMDLVSEAFSPST